jgi:hypothetical protein
MTKPSSMQVDSVSKSHLLYLISIGLFHVYVLIFFIFAMTLNDYLFYSLPFLELYPKYICPEDLPDCTYKDRCGPRRDDIKVDWDSIYSLHNWVETMDLECMIFYSVLMFF